ncbi:sulfurtransferase [Cellulosimicrobium arenosum]|uniref:Sulfurtransferase n=1 Tax=Cellulosimicrobium arenosum TaxID=2708133 RepID=A0A927J213_9MICO|nr:sulfurtransferase [Cellulosimicrobium arenosum]MBD8080481.1 sulfurtransferase [Cellulosimicrobium arenosum]
MSPARERVLVGVRELAGLLDGPAMPVVLDVRWALGVTDGHERYLAGHLPGAVYVDLETELAALPSAAAGRHPLPAAHVLQAAARRWGVRRDRGVVVYDAAGGTSAARAWWLLRWAGHDDVRILDGGPAAWERAGLALAQGEERGEPGDVVVSPGSMPVLDADAAAALAASGTGVLLDARAGERYRGEVEPVDPRAGHVPGAVSAPTTENLGDDGELLDGATLRARFDALGVSGRTPVGVYCGSGVTAAHQVAVLATLGIDAALYAGSWSQWSNDPARPAATGATAEARPVTTRGDAPAGTPPLPTGRGRVRPS